MIEYFPKIITVKAKRHAIECYPNESCGIVVDNKYIPCENISSTPQNHFEIDAAIYIKNAEKIKAIIHSHNDYPHASKLDMIQQMATNVPWGIVNVVKGNVTGTWFWGDTLPIQDYTGRPFVHGIYDCYSLVRSYYMLEKGITLSVCPRDYNFWRRKELLLTDNYIREGFIEISRSELEVGDVILANILSSVVNHSGIYIGNGLILHHLYNRLSRTEPLSRWQKYISHYLRHEGEQDA